MHKAVYMDRDGTINEDMGHLNHIDRFRLLPRSAEAIQLLNRSGFKAVVVTNQSGIAFGFYPEEFLEEVHTKMKQELMAKGAHVDGIYYCPHSPHGTVEQYRVSCTCRKPEPGLVERAARELKIDTSRSFVVGDKLADIELAQRVGAQGILVLTGYGKGEYTYHLPKTTIVPGHVAQDLYDAVVWIVEQEKSENSKKPTINH